MILKFLRNLTGPREPAQAEVTAEGVEYKGYTVVAKPKKVQGGWSTEGIISKELEGESKSQHFIRADTLMSADEAVSYSVSKAKQIIDEQGDRLFKA